MKKMLTIVFDGFGLNDKEYGNAIRMANPTFFYELWNNYPHAILKASEEAVGLEHGQFGNSEVGHLTIGAGRKLKQNITMINDLLTDSINDNDLFNSMIEDILENRKTVHIMGLLSDGKVHSDINHFMMMYDKLVEKGITDIYFHVISDGRDTPVDSFYKYYDMLDNHIKECGVGKIASICGRYYAMDRDKNWDRTEKYFKLLVRGVGMAGTSVPYILKRCYEENITDEFLPPIKTKDFHKINNGDVIIWMNYRSDRAKQILSPFALKNFSEFTMDDYSDTMTYSWFMVDSKIKTKNFLEYPVIENPIGVYLSKLGLTQARIAETEKYAHVTYFLDGEKNDSLEGCQKYLIPSPKVATYDLQPEMSAVDVTKKVVSCMEKDYDFIFVNFANPDMVGHTGNLEATIKAIKTVDLCLKLLVSKAEENFYNVVLTADHGNADVMLDDSGNPVTTHTLNDVPFILLDKKIKLKETGDLSNIAPTILDYMDIKIPKEMNEEGSLIVKS